MGKLFLTVKLKRCTDFIMVCQHYIFSLHHLQPWECKSAAIDFLSCFFREREIQTINNKELKLFCKNSKNKIYEIRQQFHHVIIQMGNNIYCVLVNFSSYTSCTNMRKIYFFSSHSFLIHFNFTFLIQLHFPNNGSLKYLFSFFLFILSDSFFVL